MSKTRQELNQEVIDLQNEIQNIETQLTFRKTQLDEKVNVGQSTSEDFLTYKRWKTNACAAKQMKTKKLRMLKNELREFNNDDNIKYQKLGRFIAAKMMDGDFCQDESGWYFAPLADEPTNYFADPFLLVEHLIETGKIRED